jgi:hypothetical protein
MDPRTNERCPEKDQRKSRCATDPDENATATDPQPVGQQERRNAERCRDQRQRHQRVPTRQPQHHRIRVEESGIGVDGGDGRCQPEHARVPGSKVMSHPSPQSPSRDARIPSGPRTRHPCFISRLPVLNIIVPRALSPASAMAEVATQIANVSRTFRSDIVRQRELHYQSSSVPFTPKRTLKVGQDARALGEASHQSAPTEIAEIAPGRSLDQIDRKLEQADFPRVIDALNHGAERLLRPVHPCFCLLDD